MNILENGLHQIVITLLSVKEAIAWSFLTLSLQTL